MVSKLLTIAPFIAAAMACSGGFAQSCSNIRLDGSTLIAYCGDGNGGYVTASTDLDTCIGNADGALVCGSGGFSNSCNDITLQGTILFATCSGTGGFTETSYELNNAIGNFGGSIHC